MVYYEGSPRYRFPSKRHTIPHAYQFDSTPSLRYMYFLLLHKPAPHWYRLQITYHAVNVLRPPVSRRACTTAVSLCCAVLCCAYLVLRSIFYKQPPATATSHTMRRRAQRQQSTCQRYHSYHTALAVAVAAALYSANTSRSQAAAFVWPSLCSAGARASGRFRLPKGAVSRGLRASLGGVDVDAPHREAINSFSRTRRVRSRWEVGLGFIGVLKLGQPCKGSDWKRYCKWLDELAGCRSTKHVKSEVL